MLLGLALAGPAESVDGEPPGDALLNSKKASIGSIHCEEIEDIGIDDEDDIVDKMTMTAFE